jgi:hypothetical protein
MIEIKNRYTEAVLKQIDAVDLRGAYLRGADLRGTYLRGADLRGADLRGTCLRGVDLQEAKINIKAIWPAPSMVLLANWGRVSDNLTRELMILDGWCHPDPSAFDRWSNGGPCPYDNVNVQRMANFTENHKLWPKGSKTPKSPYELMMMLLRECCIWEDDNEKT